MALDGVDDGRADNGAVGAESSEVEHMLARRDAEADGHRHVRVLANAFQELGDVGRKVGARASDAGDRDGVDP
eukprot:1208679-Rhodomonas_salina.3